MGFENAEVKKQQSEDTSYVDMAEGRSVDEGSKEVPELEKEEDFSTLSDAELSEERAKNSAEFSERREKYIASIEPKVKDFAQDFQPRIRQILQQQGAYPEDWREAFQHFSRISPDEASSVLGTEKPHGTDAHTAFSQVTTMLAQEFPKTKDIEREAQEFKEFSERNSQKWRELSRIIQERRKA